MAHDPDLTNAHTPPTDTFDAGLAAAFGPDLTPGGFTQPPLLRDDPSDPGFVQPSSPEMPRGSSERYQLLGEIARGGMGVVLKGRDPDLGRDLAFKVLRQELAGKPAAVQRFVEEAQVGGQLQHPGVVPVYDLGRFADGRPYFAMKLVKGRTLADLLAERPTPSADRGRFLQVFLQICQAVAYAHAKGVIHRDLKPANVMVGAFGEVLVMDWGLARVMRNAERGSRNEDSPPIADPSSIPHSEIHVPRSEDTQAGSVMGTPAFMPPEQAGGEIDKLDERADVFGLGAVLCVILTGSPPYVGTTPDEVRLLAVRGKLDAAFTRLVACAADAELVSLCKRCLSPERDARPRHAGEVAAEVQQYLANVEERARQAEVDRAAAEARAEEEVKTRKMAEAKAVEERRRRRTQLALLAMTAVVGVSVVGGWLWLRGERLAKQARARQLVETLLERAETELVAERVSEATAALAQAEPHLPDAASPELAERYAQDVKDRDMVKELDAIYEEYWKSLTIPWAHQTAEEKARNRYAQSLSGYGLSVNDSAARPTAGAVRRSRISSSLVAGLNYWFFLDPERVELRDVLTYADPDATRCAIRRYIAVKGQVELEKQVATVDWPAMPVWFTVALSSRHALDADSAIRIMKQAWAAHPASHALARRIGDRLLRYDGKREPKSGDHNLMMWEAVSWYRAAVALRPDSPGAIKYLGVALCQADATYDEVLPVVRTATKLLPDDLDVRAVLVMCLRRSKDWNGMLAAYREALRLEDSESDGYGLGVMHALADDHFVPLLAREGRTQLALQTAREFLPKEPEPKSAFQPDGGLGYSSHRYNAACAAMLCAIGKGTDCPPVSERPALRREALGYLKTDLAMWRKGFASNPNQHRNEVHSKVRHWLKDSDLAPVRDVFAVLALPTAERTEWLAFWAEVRKLRDDTAPEVLPPPRRE